MKPESSLAEWQDFLRDHPNAHILQTGEWGELKNAFGWEAVRLVGHDIGAQVLFRKIPLGFALAYIPKGPLTGDPSAASQEQFWQAVDDLCRRRRAVFLKIEPDRWEDQTPDVPLPPAFRPSPHNIQPPRTLVVDLRGSEDSILSRMKQKTRYNIRLAEKKGVRVHAWDDLPAFHRMMLVTSERDTFGVHSLAYYRKAYDLFHPSGLCDLFVAEHEHTPLAALVVFGRGERAWYFYGASTNEERQRMPTYLLQWEAMRWARGKGCSEYDLWGIPDEDEATLEADFTRESTGLWGVYRFKRGFSGEHRRAAQAQDKVYNPLLYRLYLRLMAGRERA